jgi:L-iditol 2-dehydrogenase
MVASKKINVKPLVTHHFDITETNEAFRVSRYGVDGAIKVMIHCKPRDANNKVKF